MKNNASSIPQFPNSSILQNRIALITGASRGIGQAVATRFAAEGAQVILAARGSKGLEETDDVIRSAGGTATLVAIDLTEETAIAALAHSIAARFGRLDILVGNAGLLGELSPIPHQSPESWRRVFAVNVEANLHLIRHCDALLQLSDTPRAMFVSSGVTQSIHPYWGAYAASKAALETMVQTYAAETAKTRLRVNLIDPGGVRTRMRAQAFPGEDPQTLPPPEAITDVFVKLAGKDIMQTGETFFAYT
jgi:NAD(P)-dependent dehydrogenase (short-subunit alcohol dehydrogenase family)